MLVDYQVNLKVKRVKKGTECPYYSPNTQNTLLWTFIGHMRTCHNWHYTVDHFKGFEGALSGVLRVLYTEREKLYVSIYDLWTNGWIMIFLYFFTYQLTFSHLYPLLQQGHEGYSRKNPDSRLSEEDFGKLQLSKYDKSDLQQFQEKMLVIFGIYFGFWGRSEHHQLKTIHFCTSSFPCNHPHFPALMWTGLKEMPADKKWKLGLDNGYIRMTELDKGGKFPHLPHLPHLPDFDVGRSIFCFLKLFPQEDNLLLTNSHQLSDKFNFYCCINREGTAFTNRNIRIHTIWAMVKSAFACVGINESKWSHAMRATLITRLANNLSVSTSKVMNAARHCTATASATYQQAGKESERNWIAALLWAVDVARISKDTIVVSKPNQRRRNFSFAQMCADTDEEVCSDVEDDRKMPALPVGSLLVPPPAPLQVNNTLPEIPLLKIDTTVSPPSACVSIFSGQEEAVQASNTKQFSIFTQNELVSLKSELKEDLECSSKFVPHQYDHNKFLEPNHAAPIKPPPLVDNHHPWANHCTLALVPAAWRSIMRVVEPVMSYRHTASHMLSSPPQRYDHCSNPCRHHVQRCPVTVRRELFPLVLQCQEEFHLQGRLSYVSCKHGFSRLQMRRKGWEWWIIHMIGMMRLRCRSSMMTWLGICTLRIKSRKVTINGEVAVGMERWHKWFKQQN